MTPTIYAEWQPIESAPKDGTKILIPDGIAYWRINKAYPALSDWIAIKIEGRSPTFFRGPILYWMPLPNPPTQTDRG